MSTLRTPVTWEACEYLSLSDAGRIAGKSAAWARGAVCTGDLEAVRLPTGGRDVVTVRSLKALLEKSRPASAPVH